MNPSDFPPPNIGKGAQDRPHQDEVQEPAILADPLAPGPIHPFARHHAAITTTATHAAGTGRLRQPGHS